MLFFKGLREGMQSFGKIVNKGVASIALFIAYVVGIGLVAMMAKLFGKKFLHLELDKKAPTYWEESKIGKRTKEELEKPF